MSEIVTLAKAARAASLPLAKAGSKAKDRALALMADLLVDRADAIIEANAKDVAAAQGLSAAMVDRLTLNGKRIAEMAAAVREVMALKDPVGEVTGMWKRPNGLVVGRKRIPLGVIAMVFEARPNVISDAAALCIKSGNAVILRGGKEAFHSSRAVGAVLAEALEGAGLPAACVQVMPVQAHEAMLELLQQEEYIDLVIPRGGERLIRFVVEHSKIPVLKHYKGVCHAFVDKDADHAMAADIVFNGKVQRPGVCNALECLLVHEEAAATFLPLVAARLGAAGVELRGCDRTCAIVPSAKRATPEDYGFEFLDLILAVKVVSGIDEAIGHIDTYGSLHTETIVTSDYANAQRFLDEVNSSTVIVNASTRFSDGFQLGLGSEIGISTTKLHAFGPMGLDELTTTKFIIYGNGQIRE